MTAITLAALAFLSVRLLYALWYLSSFGARARKRDQDAGWELNPTLALLYPSMALCVCLILLWGHP